MIPLSPVAAQGSDGRSGFTLLELLVALFIIGIIISMAVLSVGGGGAREILKEESRRLKALIELAAREAILNQREYGLRLTPGSYRFQMLDEEHGWRTPPDDTLLKARRLPETIRFTVLIEGLEANIEPLASDPPQLLFFSSGEITPFEMELHNRQEDRFRLVGTLTGELTLSTGQEP